ncbi:DUF72 domain-containing protein [Luteimonas sp. MC1750]|uniref:DUF72 domain-containing protein n=1 Tax=Luteimonas sp. MC1750 TaxID=2799326 RepID=UPI0018F100B6|nr:DUF72 domain-containing protein [Luteimonas sp. MC1750]MBJ6985049.1 DUF72 domain-containing protein [Luteimonas sp. MC1750]QQO05715.1 DUF72 domain-containing protein [Luteimonas sp. MC1750]
MPRTPAPRSTIRIGTAGWSIASAHRGLFGAGDSALARYATLFDATEINSSFYRPHRRETYARWAETVPAHFRYSVKLPRTITHEHGLRGALPLLDDFLAQAGGLGTRLGCLLVQLPPSLAYDGRVASAFFAGLRRRWPGGVACEARHASWFTARVDALWQRHRIARVAADPAPLPQAAEPGGHAGLGYWRWHGSPRIYYSAYDADARADLAARVRTHVAPRGEAWVIFDNTAHGHATPDAAAFQALLRG